MTDQPAYIREALASNAAEMAKAAARRAALARMKPTQKADLAPVNLDHCKPGRPKAEISSRDPSSPLTDMQRTVLAILLNGVTTAPDVNKALTARDGAKRYDSTLAFHLKIIRQKLRHRGIAFAYGIVPAAVGSSRTEILDVARARDLLEGRLA